MEDSLTAATPAEPKAKLPEIAALKRMFTESQSDTATARTESQIDDDYYHGFQLTAAERAALNKRKQPDIVFNRVRVAINGTLGVIKQGATDPRAYPRNPKDEESSEVASKTLRYIADKSNFDALKLDGSKNYLVEGTCAAIVEVDEDRNVVIDPIRWEEFFYDPRSRRQDLSDARYMGIAKWQYADDVAANYPDAKADVEASLTGGVGSVDDTFGDRPTDASNTVAWTDGRKRRLMVVEIYHREGGSWQRCVFHSGGVLAYGPSPYVDDKGRPINPIEAQSCYVDRENNRYGIVRDMRGPQDEINKRRSKLLHLISTSQTQEAQPGMGMGDIEDVRKEAAKPDGVIPSGWVRIPTTDMARGQAELLAESKAEIERMGPNPAVLGRQGENQSGRANLVRQQAGMTEQAVIFGGIEEWELRLYRQMWNRARQFWTTPMWIRVTDDEGAPEFVGINQPRGAPIVDADGQPITDEATGEPQEAPPETDQATGQPILGYKNALAEMDVDIIIDTVPDTANLQQEQFAMLVELAKVGALGENAGPMLLEASSLPNKRAVVEKMKAQAEAPPTPEAQLAQRGAAAKVAGDEAKVAETGANAALKGAQAENAKIDGMMKVQAATAGFGPMPLSPPPGLLPGAPPAAA